MGPKHEFLNVYKSNSSSTSALALGVEQLRILLSDPQT